VSGAVAPGKLVLTGEYAVLDGAPAVVTAVDRRAQVTIEPATSCRVQAQGPDIAPAAFRLAGDGILDWQPDRAAGDYRLLGAVTATLAQGGALPTDRPFDLRLDTSAFYSGADKLGLGSSAAVTVAACACLQAQAGDAVSADAALHVHRAFQNGRGSGADVCCSFYGGTVAVERHGDELAVAELDWVSDVMLVPVWTGEAASTTAMLARLEAYRAASPTACSGLFDALERAATRAVDACAARDGAGLLAAVNECAIGLRELDAASGIGIYSAAHNKLAAVAAQHGLVYKPSGAGGGDFGIAFGRDSAALAAFTAAVSERGFRAGEVETGVDGLELDSPGTR